MKNRNIIFGAILSVLACFAFSPQMQADELITSNTSEGFNSLNSLTTGGFNTGLGWFSLGFLTDASFNTAAGAGSLDLNNASFNSAFGAGALLLNQSAFSNTAVGTDALLFNDVTNNTSANLNTAVGAFALENNTDGDSNTAVGALALFNNNTIALVSGISNNAVGRGALFANTTGSFNEAMGVNALGANVIGSNNVAIGDDALLAYTGAGLVNGNTAVGQSAALFTDPIDFPNTAVGAGALTGALAQISTSGGNVAVGDLALNAYTGITATDGVNTAVGSLALSLEVSGEFNVAVGRRALNNLVGGSSNIGVGHAAGFNLSGGESGNICIGESVVGVTGLSNLTFIGNIGATANPVAGTVLEVTVETNPGSPFFNLLGFNSSSRRYKEDIKSLDKLSESLFKLRPVSYRIAQKINPAHPIGFGLIAEEVAEVNPDLVSCNSEGQPDAVQYQMVNAMLLSEFLKEHKKVEEQQASISQLKSEMQTMVAQLKEQAAQIQKVSAQLEVGKPAPQVVANKP